MLSIAPPTDEQVSEYLSDPENKKRLDALWTGLCDAGVVDRDLPRWMRSQVQNAFIRGVMTPKIGDE